MKEAADKGVVGAQYFYGYFCHRGLGVEKNEEVAREYLEKAAEAGDQRAKDCLAGFK
jgi:TPR repeat protein